MRKDKPKAIQLRKQGKTYNEISKLLSIPKSTLSGWFRGEAFSERVKQENYSRTQKIWARNITRFNKKQAETARQRAKKLQEDATKDIKALSKRELLLVGTALYWAEGYKKRLRWTLQFPNSDPAMIKLIMRFFKEVCNVPKEKIKASVQIHPNVTPKKAINYWSRVSGIPKTHFLKTYSRLTPSSKQKRPPNTLPYGTLRITIYNAQVANKVKGWIRGITRKI